MYVSSTLTTRTPTTVMAQAVIRSAPGALPPSASPLHLQIAAFGVYRSDGENLLNKQLRIELAESNANMGHHLPYHHFAPTFLPDSTERHPPSMPAKIVQLIEDASSEKQIAEAWVGTLRAYNSSTTCTH